MATIITRSGKGSPLTNTEVDNNFTNLNSDKLESGDTVASLTLTSADINGGTIDGTVIGGSTPAAISGTTGTFSGNLTVDTDTLFVNAANNRVGIGTSSPQARLHVFNDQGGANGRILIDANVTSGYDTKITATDVGLEFTAVSNSRSFLFNTGSTPTERMRITYNGDISFYEDTGTTPKFFWDASAEALGIGTSSPATKLAVVGTGNTAVTIQDSSGVAYLDFTTGAGTQRILGGAGGTNSLLFYTGLAERMRITSTGNVGIGTSSPDTFGKLAVQVAGTTTPTSLTTLGPSSVNLYAGTNGASADCTTGIFGWNFTGGIGSGIGFSRENLNNWGTQIRFYTHPTPTANAGDVTERARIDASGSLLVGTTSNPDSRRFRVYGVSEFDGDGVGLTVYKSSGTDIGFAGQGNYVVTGGPSDGFGIRSQTALVFGSGGATERARIDSSGNLLVGTTSTTVKFGVVGTTAGTARIINNRNVAGDYALTLGMGANAQTTASYYLICQEPGVINRLFIYGNGDVVNVNNSYGGISDERVKENIIDATPKLEQLNQVRVVNYNLIGEEHKQIGVIAQELEQIFPGMVEETPDRDAEGNDLGTTTKSVKYSVFVPILIKAMQEQQAIIEALEARITALEAQP